MARGSRGEGRGRQVTRKKKSPSVFEPMTYHARRMSMLCEWGERIGMCETRTRKLDRTGHPRCRHHGGVYPYWDTIEGIVLLVRGPLVRAPHRRRA